MLDLAPLLARLSAASPLPFNLNRRRCHRLDLSGNNPELRGMDPGDTMRFSAWVARQIAQAGADYAAGGYAENRELYAMSPVFRSPDSETRTLHLGIDLWLPAATTIHAVLPGVVHSARDNGACGDYGPTLIFEHRFEGTRFYTLYGHLSRPSLELTPPGQFVEAGRHIAWLGEENENGGWPPHLHFQLIRDLGGREGDYPGVCVLSERAQWLQDCPDPNLLLRIEALRDSR